MDKIRISRLKIRCNHGVYEKEKLEGQNFYVSAALHLDTYPAGVSDNLDKSVNYGDLCHAITNFMQSNTYDLIETVAHKLSVFLLNYSPLIRGLDLTISKPEAPIGLPFEDVTIEITRAWHTAYIAYGSNIGDSQQIIDEAIAKINNHPDIRLIKQSSTITTKPYGGVEQPDFLNGCIQIETYLSPQTLLDELHIIENEAGRVREIHWGPRTLDLDILLYDEEIINTPELTIPHIDMANRGFVLEPLNEIAPYVWHPILGKNIQVIYNKLIKTV